MPRLIVADSSDDGIRAQNRAMAGKRKDHLTYLEYPVTVKPLDKFVNALEHVSTPYVLICADDDLVFLESVAECVQFLEEHSEYIASHGTYLGFREMPVGVEIDRIEYNSPSLDSDSPNFRVFQLLGRYEATVYAVFRTPILQSLFRTSREFESLMFWELYLSAATAVCGKIKRLENIYYARNSGRVSHPRERDEPNRWMATDFDSFISSYGQFRRRTADLAIQQHGETFNRSQFERSLDIAFTLYLNLAFDVNASLHAFLENAKLDGAEADRARDFLSTQLFCQLGSKSSNAAIRLATLKQLLRATLKQLLLTVFGTPLLELLRRLSKRFLAWRVETAEGQVMANVAIAPEVARRFTPRQWRAVSLQFKACLQNTQASMGDSAVKRENHAGPMLHEQHPRG